MLRTKKDSHDALRTAPDSLSLADLAHYISGADDRRQAGDQVMERLRELVTEIDADAKLHLARRGMGRTARGDAPESQSAGVVGDFDR